MSCLQPPKTGLLVSGANFSSLFLGSTASCSGSQADGRPDGKTRCRRRPAQPSQDGVTPCTRVEIGSCTRLPNGVGRCGGLQLTMHSSSNQSINRVPFAAISYSCARGCEARSCEMHVARRMLHAEQAVHAVHLDDAIGQPLLTIASSYREGCMSDPRPIRLVLAKNPGRLPRTLLLE